MKEARLTKKGKSGANLANGSVIETLIILSTDIVQVVAKVCNSFYFKILLVIRIQRWRICQIYVMLCMQGVLFPTDGITGNISGGNVEAAVTNAPSSEVVAIEAKKSNNFTVDKKKFNHNRYCLVLVLGCKDYRC